MKTSKKLMVAGLAASLTLLLASCGSTNVEKPEDTNTLSPDSVQSNVETDTEIIESNDSIIKVSTGTIGTTNTGGLEIYKDENKALTGETNLEISEIESSFLEDIESLSGSIE